MSKTKRYSKVIYLVVALALVLSFSLVTAVPALAAPQVTFRSAGSSPGADSTSCVIPKPAGLAVGDLMIAQVFGIKSTSLPDIGTFTAPAGWTSIRQDTRYMSISPYTGYMASALFWKIADASDVAASTFTFTATGATSNRGAITAWYGHNPINPIDAHSGTTSSTSTTITAPSISPSVADCNILFFCGIYNDLGISSYAVASGDPSSWSEAYDLPSNLTYDLNLSLGYGTRSATGATGDGTATIASPGTYNIGQLVAIAPNINYDLTTSSTAGGSVTTPGEGVFTYDEGTVVDLVATPGAGYRFDEWTGDVGTIADVNAAATTITMNGDYSITAEFVRQYDLTTSSTAGGSVTTPGEGTFTYDEGTVVDLVATPGAGYRFDEWTGDVGTIADVNDATTTITMNGDYSVTANFVKQYDLTISNGTEGGSITTPGEGVFTYDDGTVVDLVAEAAEGYRFVEWTGDVGNIADVNAAATNIAIHSSYEITASFEENSPSPAGGCFIATAAYGTPMAEEIQILRDFRDEYLLTNPVGQILVDLYYRNSPPIAEFITEHSSLKPIVRAGLLPIVAMSTIAVNATLAENIAIISLLALVSVAVATWATRRQGRDPQYT